MPPRVPVIPGSGASPAVHGLVIGVGNYVNPGAPSLAGTTASALAFADWLADEHTPPGFARGSIDVLVSQPSGQPVTWRGQTLDAPTTAKVGEAIDALHARVDPSPADMVVFYFCGHGIELGDLRSLLLEDVDLRSTTNPFRNAIAFDDFVDGMASCGPRQQVYVLDACRELPMGYEQWSEVTHLGEPMVLFNAKRKAKLGSRTHVILDATSSDQKAWSSKAGAWFTDALLTVLKGAAGDNRFTPSETEYSINTKDIAETVKSLVARGFLDPPAGPQVAKRRGEGDLEFHVPKHPIVPILVTRKSAINAGDTFVALQQANAVKSFTATDARPWRDSLPIGDYVFQHDADTVAANVWVPAKRVELP